MKDKDSENELHTRRPLCHPFYPHLPSLPFHFTPQDIVALRPSLLVEPISNRQSQKLWGLLTGLAAQGKCSYTFGALDPVQVIQMAPHVSTIYVSGWQCSSTASTSNEPGPDFADYPMDTVCCRKEWREGKRTSPQ